MHDIVGRNSVSIDVNDSFLPFSQHIIHSMMRRNLLKLVPIDAFVMSQGIDAEFEKISSEFEIYMNN